MATAADAPAPAKRRMKFWVRTLLAVTHTLVFVCFVVAVVLGWRHEHRRWALARVFVLQSDLLEEALRDVECPLGCSSDLRNCSKREPSVAATAARKQGYVVLDARSEQMSANRWCIAHAIRVAQLTGRALVAPSYWQGRIVNPKPPPVPDFLDYWDVPDTFDIPIVRMHEFLAFCDLGFVRVRNGVNVMEEWVCQGAPEITVQTEIIIAGSAGPEEEIAQRLSTRPRAHVLLIHDPSRWCVNLHYRATPERKSIGLQLDQPRPCISQFVERLRSLLILDEQSLVVHWRSMNNLVYNTVTHNLDPKAPRLQPGQLPTFHSWCAHRLVEVVSRILNNTPQLTQVVFFSDIHAGCRNGYCGYLEFEERFKDYPKMNADRDNARHFLASRGWTDGDMLVGIALEEFPVFGRQELDSDGSALGMMIGEVLATAPYMLTCGKDENFCAVCARSNSGFVEDILRRRDITAKKGLNKTSWKTWNGW